MREGLSRRALLTMAAAGGATGVVGALGGGDGQGSITGGDMALSQAYNVSGELWIGPDSAKSNVSAESGRIYTASDTQVDYYGDAGSWVKMGVGSASEPVPEVTADQLNNERRPAPGELQNVLNNEAAAGDRVILHAGKDYDPGSETTVPQGVELYGNGATFKPQTDYDLLFVDSGATSTGILIDFSDVTSPTSRGVRIASGEATADYQSQNETAPRVQAAIFGKNDSETAMELEDDGSGIIGGWFDIKAIHCSIGVRGNVTSGGFINGARFDIEISDCGKGIVHDGGGSTPAYRSSFHGYIEPGGTSTHAIQNNTSAKSVNLTGHVWDSQVFSTNALEGPNISVFDPIDGSALLANSDGASNQVVATFENGFFTVVSSDTHGIRHRESTSGNNRVAYFTARDRGDGGVRVTAGGRAIFDAFRGNAGKTLDLLGTLLLGEGFGMTPVLLGRGGPGWRQEALEDPGTTDLDDGQYSLVWSDGSADIQGDAGDLIAFRNNGGTIEWAPIVDASADFSAV